MNRPNTKKQWKQWVSDREINGRSMTPAMIRDEDHSKRIKEAREVEANFSLPFNLKT
ncbi:MULTISPECIES: hypothetical protein [unclassified Caballeronia]|uniref:hypothetical protein n=1 Tax=unclassified Caballeronia TaxID=2646786 RepID=UPI001F35EAE1|nr:MULTISPECIES: hypothetical protein [unclassified Caballeronia]MCE4542127.1 hypothetical protein [Caballeronia sp. PC1]MCE4568827.1 hypothetical protein [Caballeronia sp. CLC5]